MHTRSAHQNRNVTASSAHHSNLPLDFTACYRAASGRDARWDGRIYLGVSSTGIYCRPSCPARKPKPENSRFFPSAAACVAAGFRACKRCRPDALPGTRDWDARSDLSARALRRIHAGAVDTVGVAGLAAELTISERHLRRILIEEIGANPHQIARTRRAHTARTLIEETTLSLTEVAYAAGFGSLRQFSDTMRVEFGIAPSRIARNHSEAAKRNSPTATATPAATTTNRGADAFPRFALQLRTRAPYDGAAMRAFLVAHAIPGRDHVAPDGSTMHALDLPGGTGAARINWAAVPEPTAQPSGAPATIGIPVELQLPSLTDTLPAIHTLRKLLDLDADPALIAEVFGEDETLGPLLAKRPGLRLPGARNPVELALGTVLGQQVSLAAARTLQGRLATAFETRNPPGTASRAASVAGFCGPPDPARIAALPVEQLRGLLGITRARAETLSTLANALIAGLDVGTGADRERTRTELLTLRGIGPWTVEMIAMRALNDPDAWPAGDLVLRRALGARNDREVRTIGERWRPYRGYATQHLWADVIEQAGAPPSRSAGQTSPQRKGTTDSPAPKEPS